VLATFGLILFFKRRGAPDLGPGRPCAAAAGWLTVPVQIIPGVYYPAYRLSIIAVALAVAALLISS